MRNRLLIFSTLCVAGTVNGALLGDATGLLVGLASNILVADLGLVWDRVARRLSGRDAVLQNTDLSQAVGNAIAVVIAKASQLEQYRDYRKPLQRLANRAVSGWTELAQLPEFSVDGGVDPVQEVNLAQLFSVKPSEFAQVKALTPPEWTQVLNTWQQQDPEFIRDPQVIGEIAEMLHQQFPKALREVLKEDFATGGRVFAGLVLDLVGDLCEALREQHEAVLGRLDQLGEIGVDQGSLAQDFQRGSERLDALSVRNEAAFQALSGQIESGFENIAQLLAEARIRDDIQQLGEKLDGLERPMLTVSVVIDTSRSKVSHWQGRAEELTTLRHQLERVSLVGILGLVGYGKSALANHLYETSDYPAKIWVTLNQPYRFSELGRWLLGKFGLQIEERVEDEALATALTNCLTEQRSLVVLDNLETLLDGQGQWLLPGYETFLLKWLEYGSGSTILVTSREQPQLPPRNNYWHPALTGLKVTEGAALLRDYGVVGDEATMQAFVALTEGHPLLLGLAAALLQDELGENPDIAGLKKPELNLFEIVGLHRGDPEASLNKLFTASFERLEERLQRLLCGVSVYRLPFSAAAAAVMLKETALTWQAPATQQQIEQDLRHLAKRSLLQEAKCTTVTERRFQFLPLIASYVQQQQCDWEWAHERAIFFYRATANSTSWNIDEDLREYFEAFHHHCKLQQFALAADVLDICNNFLSLRGYNRTLVQLYGRLVKGWQPSSSQDWSDFSWALTSLGNAYNALGNYAKAIDYYEQSLKIEREIGDHDREGAALNNLGNAYYSLCEYAKAIDYYEQSLKIKREIGDRNGEGNSLNNLGNAYYSLCEYAKAIDYHEQSLKISREIGDHNREGTALGNLGNAYDSLGDCAKAIDYYEQSLKIQREIGDHDREGAALGSLGNAYKSLGEYAKAIDYYEQSLKIQREIGDRNEEGASLNNLGAAYFSLGNYAKAIDYYEQSLKISREIGDHDREGAALGNLSAAYLSLGEYAKAIDYHEQSLKIQREIGDHDREGAALGNLSAAYLSLGEYAKAIDYHEQSLKIQREIGDHNEEGAALNNLGLAYLSLGEYAKAIDYHEQSLKIQREIGDRNEEGAALNNLGAAYFLLGEYAKAIDYYEQSLKIQREIGDRNRESTALGNLGNAYYSLCEYVKAIDYHEQALKIKREIGDRNGEGASLNNLGAAYFSFGNYAKAIDYDEQSLKIQREIGDRNEEGNSLIGLGNAYFSLGDYAKAIDYYEQALKIQREIGDRNREGTALIGLGNAYNALGDYAKAIDYHKQGLKISHEIGDRNRESTALGNLGNAYYSLCEYVKAIDYHEQALKIKREIGHRHGEAIAWLNLGNTLTNVDRVPDALGAYRNARKLFADMELESYVQDCDNAIQQLSSVPDSPQRPKPRHLLVRLWQWFKHLMRSILSQ